MADIEDPAAMIGLIDTEQEYDVNQIVEGRIIRVEGDFVLVDVGYKSEGSSRGTSGTRTKSRPQSARSIKVLIEDVEDEPGLVDDPRHDHAQQAQGREDRAWEKVMESVQEGDVVTGTVTRKIKGGLLVDIGVNVFLPASQVDIRRPADIGDYIGRDDPVHGAEDRRGAAEHRRQPPGADRSRAGARRRPRSCWPSWKSASAARASSRTSPSSARSSTWAASTACCTSPT